MTNSRNIIVEQQVQPRQYTAATISIQQGTNSFVHTQQRQLIPVNFVQLESKRRNNVGPAEEFDDKPGYERYYFFHEDKGHNLDLNFELVGQLGLTRGQNCEHTIYVSNEILNRSPEEGGITIDNVEDIILVRPGTILEREVQTESVDHEVSERINELTDDLNEIEEILINKNTKISEIVNQLNTFQTRINTANNTINNLNQQLSNLTDERNANQQNINQFQEQTTNLRTQLTDLQTENRNALQTLGINNLNDLPNLLRGENLTNLLNRPTQQQLQAEQNARRTAEQQTRQTQTQLTNVANQRNDLQNIINNAQNSLGIDNLTQSPILPEGQTLQTLINFCNNTPQDWHQQMNNANIERDSLMNKINNLEREKNEIIRQRDERPRREDYEETINERNRRPNVSQGDYKKLLQASKVYQSCDVLGWSQSAPDQSLKIAETLESHPQITFLFSPVEPPIKDWTRFPYLRRNWGNIIPTGRHNPCSEITPGFQDLAVRKDEWSVTFHFPWGHLPVEERESYYAKFGKPMNKSFPVKNIY